MFFFSEYIYFFLQKARESVIENELENKNHREKFEKSAWRKTREKKISRNYRETGLQNRLEDKHFIQNFFHFLDENSGFSREFWIFFIEKNSRKASRNSA